MTAIVEEAPDSNKCSDEQRPMQPITLSSFALRDNARLTIIRPGIQPGSHEETQLPLEMPGSYFCINFAGQALILQDGKNQLLTSGKLHILRQPVGSPDRTVKFGSAGSLAILIFFSLQWCASCPQGPTCRVAKFLLDKNAGNDESSGLTLELDKTGSAIARSLLDTHVDEDSDALLVEQSVLALLSWAFGKHTLPRAGLKRNITVHPRAALKTRQAAEILRQRLENPPTIAKLSGLVGMNECDLKRSFKCIYGRTIASYSRHNRLEAARNLLAHSSLGVARIALEIGFSNPSQFARAFRLQFGINPAEFRRSSL